MNDKIRAFLQEKRFAVLATVRDGTPQQTVMWYELQLQEGRIMMNTAEGRVKEANLRRDPRISVTVIDEADFYTHVSFVGRVAEWGEDEQLADIDRLSQRYTGRAYPVRDRPRVSAWVTIERWHGWGATREG